MAQGGGRSSPASPRPAEGGADLGGCGPQLKAFGRWALFLAPLPAPRPGPASSARTGLLGPCSVSGRAISITGTCHWPARPWGLSGRLRPLLPVPLDRVKVGGLWVKGLRESRFSFALEQRKASPQRAAWSQTAEVIPWRPPPWPPRFRAPCGVGRVPRAGPRALGVRFTLRSRPHGPGWRQPSLETPHSPHPSRVLPLPEVPGARTCCGTVVAWALATPSLPVPGDTLSWWRKAHQQVESRGPSVHSPSGSATLCEPRSCLIGGGSLRQFVKQRTLDRHPDVSFQLGGGGGEGIRTDGEELVGLIPGWWLPPSTLAEEAGGRGEQQCGNEGDSCRSSAGKRGSRRAARSSGCGRGWASFKPICL